MGKTTIEWTDASWNPIVGCTEISPGCANCYAARLAATRLRSTPQYKGLAELRVVGGPECVGVGHEKHPRWNSKVRLLPERLEEPFHLRDPQKIFVCDMGDLFHEDVPDEFIDSIFAVMAICQRHIFQILTKRPHRMKSYLEYHSRAVRVSLAVYRVGQFQFVYHNMPGDIVQVIEDEMQKPLPNLWLGVSVENQHFADERIPLLLKTPAAVRWISAEPLLGPIDLNNLHPPNYGSAFTHTFGWPSLDWVVAGGESGPNARPMHPDWARALRDQCQAAGVPFFFKQWGAYTPYGRGFIEREKIVEVPHTALFRVGKKAAGRLLDGREWNEFPEVKT